MSTSARIRRFEERVQGSSLPPATPSMSEVCREAIIMRTPDMERICPRAVDLAADQLAALHASINGRAVELCGNRAPSYFREALRGDRALTGEDIARLAVQAPADLVAWTHPLLLALASGDAVETGNMLAEVASTLGLRVVPLEADPVEIHEAVAGVAQEAGEVVAVSTRALADNRVDAVEAELIETQVHELEQKLISLRVSLRVSRNKALAAQGGR